jgi:acyl-CoA hydrolase
MENHRLVLPGDLNQFGFLFGGKMLAWVDEASWIAASLDFPGCHFVTVAMDRVEFRQSVREGAILTIHSTLRHEGKTSVTYAVEVHGGESAEQPVFATNVTFVRVDEQGGKLPVRGGGGAS